MPPTSKKSFAIANRELRARGIDPGFGCYHRPRDELIRDLPVYPVTLETGVIAGRIEGGRAEQGVTVGFEDLLIAATALQLGFGVVTGNVRHFRHIPGLSIVQT